MNEASLVGRGSKLILDIYKHNCDYTKTLSQGKLYESKKGNNCDCLCLRLCKHACEHANNRLLKNQ